MEVLANDEHYEIKAIKLKTKGLLIIQLLFLLGWAYAAHEFWDSITVGGTVAYVAWGMLVYIIFFFGLIVNMLIKKVGSIRAAKIKLVIIFILNIIPAILLIWFAASDIS